MYLVIYQDQSAMSVDYTTIELLYYDSCRAHACMQSDIIELFRNIELCIATQCV